MTTLDFDHSVFVRHERLRLPTDCEPGLNPFFDLKVFLEDLQPIEILDFAAKTLDDVGIGQRRLRQLLFRSGYYETSLLMKAMEWLAERRAPESLLDPDTPDWLFDLDCGVARAAKRRTYDDDHVSYIIEVELNGGTTGCLQARLDEHGTLCNAWVIAEPIDYAARLIRAVDADPRPYRTIKPATALRELQRGRAKSGASPEFVSSRFNPWPANRALLDFVLDHFEPA